jgi:hypothetical protein
VDIASWGVTMSSYEEDVYAASKCTATENGYLVETTAGVKFEITHAGENVVIQQVDDES